jgi:hypothetical protein
MRWSYLTVVRASELDRGPWMDAMRTHSDFNAVIGENEGCVQQENS